MARQRRWRGENIQYAIAADQLLTKPQAWAYPLSALAQVERYALQNRGLRLDTRAVEFVPESTGAWRVLAAVFLHEPGVYSVAVHDSEVRLLLLVKTLLLLTSRNWEN